MYLIFFLYWTRLVLDVPTGLQGLGITRVSLLWWASCDPIWPSSPPERRRQRPSSQVVGPQQLIAQLKLNKTSYCYIFFVLEFEEIFLLKREREKESWGEEKLCFFFVFFGGWGIPMSLMEILLIEAVFFNLFWDTAHFLDWKKSHATLPTMAI